METSGKERTAYDRERYLLLRDQLQAIAYEYDIAKDIMVFSYGGGEGRECRIEDYRKKLCTINRETVHQDFLDKLLAAYMGQSVEPQEVLLDPDKSRQGEYSWHRILSKAICDERGRVVRTIGILWNIEDATDGDGALLRFRSAHDPLTGLYNRIGAERAISSYLAAAEADAIGALLLLRIDDFEQINDTRGQSFGEHVLVSLSREILQLFRTSDIVAYIDRGQFLILMKNVKDLMIVPRKADKLRHIFDSEAAGLYTVNVPCHVGTAIFPYDGKEYQELLLKADEAIVSK